MLVPATWRGAACRRPSSRSRSARRMPVAEGEYLGCRGIDDVAAADQRAARVGKRVRQRFDRLVELWR